MSSFDLLCTLGVGIWTGIGLSTIAVSFDGHAVSFGLVAGIVVLTLLSCGGFVFSSEVTCFSFVC
jgi:hypothetical protein